MTACPICKQEADMLVATRAGMMCPRCRSKHIITDGPELEVRMTIREIQGLRATAEQMKATAIRKGWPTPYTEVADRIMEDTKTWTLWLLDLEDARMKGAGQ